MRRTQLADFVKVEIASDLTDVVKDKRHKKRATKNKVTRRNRHYEKLLLKQLKVNL
jgi:hypothetical protein